MNCGLIVIALSVEYGDDLLGGILLIGSSCRMWMIVALSQRAMAAMSPISPMPHERDEGREKSGISVPARRVIRRLQSRCNRNAAT